MEKAKKKELPIEKVLEILSKLEQEDVEKARKIRENETKIDEELENVNAKIGQAEQIEKMQKELQEAGEQIQTLREERELAKQQREQAKKSRRGQKNFCVRRRRFIWNFQSTKKWKNWRR